MGYKGGNGQRNFGSNSVLQIIERGKRFIWRKLANAFNEAVVNRRLFVADLIICGASIAMAMILRLGIFTDPLKFEPLLILVPVSIAVAAMLFPLSGVYRRHARSTSLPDAVLIAKTALVLCGSVALIWAMLFEMRDVPRSSYIIQFFLAVPMLLAVRLSSRRDDLRYRGAKIAKQPGKSAERIPALLVGTGTSCDLLLRALLRDPNRTYDPIGILDDVQGTRGLHFHDVPIWGSIREIDEVIKALPAHAELPRNIILTEPMSHFASDGIETLLQWADRSGMAVSKLPGMDEIRGISADTKFVAQEVNVDDILKRPQKVIERTLLERMSRGRRVLVTGAGGSIGSELVRQIASLGPEEIILIENNEYNLYEIDNHLQEHFPEVPRKAHVCCVRDRSRIFRIFEDCKPELVFNAAALKHVPIVELNPCEGVLTNCIGTRNVADAARAAQADAMVQISTDKAVNATNVMGASKRVAELYCQAHGRKAAKQAHRTRFMTVRFGNVLGSSGSLIPLFQRQIAQGGPMTITDPRMERYFMTIREAVELTLLASARGLEDDTSQGAIFVLDMGKPVKIIDVAERMIKLAGLRPNVDIEIKFIGPRPGEKLFEELFDADEAQRPSNIPGVSVAVPAGANDLLVAKAIADLEEVAKAGDADGVIDLLTRLVPGYRSKTATLVAVPGSKTGATKPRGKPAQQTDTDVIGSARAV